ncbi:hypothetical protein [Kitasatospora sp. NPDC058218]|uniref:hypothetical protein n=1 Tax=Kitasatospora sp. NPDC058218 TaxID=3346385 RepID=UPI0036DBC440
MELLLELGRCEPHMALAGKPLVDQSAMVEGLLAGGWARGALISILSAPLPEKITRSVGAIISARLSKIPPHPPVFEIKGTPVTVPAPRVTYDCDVCRDPGKTQPGVCRKCRADAPTVPLTGAVMTGSWRDRVPV